MSNVIVLGSGLEKRTAKSGRDRFTMVIKNDLVRVDLDPKTLGKPVVDAIVLHLKAAVKGITEQASPATIKAREVARKAFARGEAWAMKRYSGGRMGAREPGQTDRKFNDSGRLAESIAATATKDGVWRVNVAANRFDPSTLNGGAAGVERVYQDLVRLVPEFVDMGKLMDASDIVRARVNAQRKMISRQAFGSAVGLIGDAIDTARRVGGIFGG